MVTVKNYILMEIFIKEFMKIIFFQETELIFGKMGLLIKASLKII